MSDSVARPTLGPYELHDEIGRGGMARVFKACHPPTERYVALKVLRDDHRYVRDAGDFAERFRREARVVAALEHRHILPVYDFGEDGGVFYIAMRYLSGGSLEDLLAAGRMTLPDVARILGNVAEALDYAHRKGVIHRDVKPANVLLDDEGVAYLSDFGVARVVDSSTKMTQSGLALGTPVYMSPEQSLGEPVDARSDVYSLGVMAYEMVVGQVPFGGTTPVTVAMGHINEVPPAPQAINPDVPDALVPVLARALAKSPDERYQTAQAFAAALADAVNEAATSDGGAALATLLPVAKQAHQTRIRHLPSDARPINLDTTAAPDDVAGTTNLGNQPTSEHVLRRPLTLGSTLLVAAAGLAVIAVGAFAWWWFSPDEPAGAAGPPPTAVLPPVSAGGAVGVPPALVRYDSFAEDELSLDLWAVETDDRVCAFEPGDGVLRVTLARGADEGCALVMLDPLDVRLAEAVSIGATFTLAEGQGRANGELGLLTPDGPNAVWGTCGLTQDVDGVTARLTLWAYAGDGEFEEYDSVSMPVVAGQPHDLRLTANTVGFDCRVNGERLGLVQVPGGLDAPGLTLERRMDFDLAAGGTTVFEVRDVGTLHAGR